jgi:hypothetical protein
MSTAWKISAPKPGGGFNKADHVDHLLIFIEPRAEEVPKYASEGTQIAAKTDYTICIDCNLVLTDQLVYGDALAPRIIDAGEVVAGKLAVGQARAGRSAPYLLEDPTAADLQRVESFLERTAVRMPSGKIVIEAPATPFESEVI